MKKNKEHNVNVDFLKLQYQVLSDRRINHNTLLWNTPSLFFVAQAFLWGIALDREVPLVIRCLVSFTSVLVGIISLQSFVRNRLMEVTDAEQLYSIEVKINEINRKNKKDEILIIHHKPEKRTLLGAESMLNFLSQNPVYKHRLGQKSAFALWQFLFWAILVLAFIILSYNIILIFRAYINFT